jgi:hypothetical protein
VLGTGTAYPGIFTRFNATTNDTPRLRCQSKGLEEVPIQPYVVPIDTWPNDWAASPRY